jgi:hypothetical protein
MKRRDLLALGLASFAASALAPRFAMAQGKYPERPIKLMVAFSAGGVNDVVARQWAERVKLLLGTVYVENQGGGSGTIATGEVARALPDGYTILLGSTSTMVLNPMTMAKVPYEPARDFVPIAILAVSTTSIVVHESVPAKTLKELIAYAKANPGKLSYGSAGTGTMSNLSGELFKQLTGLNDVVHIPYKGAGPGDHRSRQRTHPDDEPQCHRADSRAASRRQDPHSGGERGGTPHGRARHPDRHRGRRSRHDRPFVPRLVRSRCHTQAHHRSHRRDLACGDG